MNHSNKIDNALNFLCSLSIEDIFEHCTLADSKLETYLKKLSLFEREHQNGLKTTEKGKSLEELVVFIASSTNFFEVFPNIRTSNNEIDALLKTKIGVKPILEKFLNIDTDILFECKNYKKKVDVTWVGKFHSLLRNQGCKFGVIFSYEGFTGGSRWTAASGLVRKIYLKDEILILDFNYNDFLELSRGDNFLSIINSKIDTIKHDTLQEIKQYCVQHEAEAMLS